MFAIAKCGHCGNSGTRLIVIEPAGGNYQQSATCCSSCNAILGISGYYDEAQLLMNAEAKVDALAQKVSDIEHQLRWVSQAIQNLGR